MEQRGTKYQWMKPKDAEKKFGQEALLPSFKTGSILELDPGFLQLRIFEIKYSP